MIPTNPIPEVPNYGSSAQYKDLPSPEQIRAGVIPLDSLPAAWWNALWACTNTAVNDARSAVGTLINEICNAITGAGICINESCIDQLYQAIDTIRQRVGNAVTAGAVKSSSNCGEVSIDANGIMTANGVGNAALLNTSSKVIVNAINELKTTYDCCLSDLSGCISGVDNSKAPTSHASANTTYGVGNADCYGHLKISDEYTCCVGAAADGVAASQQALYCVYNAIQAAASLGNTAGCALGAASAGTATTAARSDHVHPITGIMGTCVGGGYYGLAPEGNDNVYVRTGTCGLIPYASDSTNGCGCVGTSTWPFKRMYAKIFCGNLCGTASSASYATCANHAEGAGSAAYADRAKEASSTCWTGGVVCFYTSGCNLCVCNTASNGVISVPDASQSSCCLFARMIYCIGVSPVMWLGGKESRCLGRHSCFNGMGSISVKGLNVW